jgi:hypothetical protein
MTVGSHITIPETTSKIWAGSIQAPQTPCRAAAGLSSNVVGCIGPLLSDDPQRREWTAERPGAHSDTDNLAFEGGCDFDDRRTLGDEGP